jgi:type I restriction enzyme S subunit
MIWLGNKKLGVSVMKNKKNVPELRFSEFNSDWIEKRLEELFQEFQSGNNITSTDIYENGSYPVFGGNGLRGYTENYTHDGFYFLIGRQGALCGNIKRVKNKVYVSEHAIACKANHLSDTEWLAQRLDYYNLNKLSESSAQPGLSVKKLLRFKLFVPTKKEQEKIANFLSAVDKKLTQIRRKKELLETYKRGLMQKLFSQQIRFKQDDGTAFPDWEEKKFGDLIKNYGGSPLENLVTKDGSHKFISIGNYSTQGKYIDNGQRINLDGKAENKQLNKCDLVMVLNDKTSNGDLIGSTILIEEKDKYVYNQRSERIVCLPILLPKFAWLFVNSREFRKKIFEVSQGGTQIYVNFSEVKKLNFPIPSLLEQQKIANCLTALDKKIEAVAQQIHHTEQFKKGLLQKMFV